MNPEERARLAESQMLNDESLRGDLDDTAAQPLLNWAVIRARRLAMKTVAMSEADGDYYFEMANPLLRRAVRKINKIGGGLPGGSAESILPELEAIIQSAIQLPDLLAIPSGDVPALATELSSLSPADAVNKLITMLTLQE